MATLATLCLGTHRAKPFKKFQVVLARFATDAESKPDIEARPSYTYIYMEHRENDLECADDELEDEDGEDGELVCF